MHPSYSVVIVNYNGGSLIRDCIASVFQHTTDFELILVDNNSVDGSDRLVEMEFPTILIVRNHQNIGFAKASNLGIMKAKGRWIVLLNPDTIVTKCWLQSLRKCVENAPKVGVATPKLLRPDGVTLDSTGHLFDFRTGDVRDRGSEETDKGQYNREEWLPSCSFACAMIRRSVIEDIGLLDEKMILYFEDVDFCIRAWIAGWKVRYCPNSVVYHVRGGLTKGSTHLIIRAIPYRMRMMLKCYSARNLMRTVPGRILRDLMAIVAGLKNRDLQYFLDHLRPGIWNLVNLPIGERILAQARRSSPDDVVASMSTPIQG